MSKLRKGYIAIYKARWLMFFIWIALFLVYALSFFSQARTPGISANEANEAGWTVIYILGPVLTAFASFYLGETSEHNLEEDKGKMVTFGQLGAMLLITAVFHFVVLYYFWLNVWNNNFSFSDRNSESYTALANYGFKLLMFLGAGQMIAVNFLLGRKDVKLGSQPKLGDESH